MSYLDLYKKRVSCDGNTLLEVRKNTSRNNLIRNIRSANGYYPATYKSSDNQMGDIDIIVRSSASEFEKKIVYVPSDHMKIGTYVSFKDDFTQKQHTYIIREINYTEQLPVAKVFLCNQRINLTSLKEPIPCFSNNTSFGTKGIEDTGRFYELDSKTRIYIQRNEHTNFLGLNKRIMFNNEYIYRIVEIEDTIWNGMYVIVCLRDESYPMDNFEDNIAWNGDENIGKTDTLIEGEEYIRVGTEQTYTSNTLVTWEIDNIEDVEVIRRETKSITLKGVKSNWIELKANGVSGSTILNIMIHD